MTRRWVFWIALLPLMLYAVHLFAPGLIESQRNTVYADLSVRVSSVAEQLHQSLRIADMHADSLLWGRNLLDRSSRGHVDIPRLIEGNVALQVFSIVSKTPRNLNIHRNDSHSDNITLLAVLQGWPLETWGSLLQRALYQSHRLREITDDADGELVLIRSSGDLVDYLQNRNSQPPATAALLALEGLHVLEGKLENVDALHKAGYRMAGLTHFFDNVLGGSAHGLNKPGLSDFGRQVIRRMESRGMLIDLAHASGPLIDDVLSMATRPVVVSHTGVKGTCDNARNLSDHQIRGIAQTGGLIGIGFWPTAVCGTNVMAVARAIDYAVSIAGIRHVALGSDFDGSVQTPFDASELASLTAALIESGHSEADIRRIMGENLLELLVKTLPAAHLETDH